MSFVVLVADANPERGRFVAETLRADSYGVIRAFDAMSMLALAREHHPDAVVIDPRLGGTMIDVLAKQLRRTDGSRPMVLVMLGDRDYAAVREIDGIDYHLPASFDLAQLSGLLMRSRR